MSQSLEGALTLRERAQLRIHLLFCQWCALYLNQLGFLRNLLPISDEDLAGNPAATPSSLTPEAAERLKRSLERADQ